MKLKDIIEFVNTNSSKRSRKWSIEQDQIIVNHTDKGDGYKYIILIIATILISSTLFVSLTLYNYSDIFLNIYILFIFFIIFIILFFVYNIFQKPILKINFKKRILITPTNTYLFTDVKKYFCKKIYIMTSYKINSSGYNILIQFNDKSLINLTDIKSIEKSKELCKILKNNFNNK